MDSMFYRKPQTLVEQLVELSLKRQFTEGCTIVSHKTGDTYTMHHVDHGRETCTLRRATPKVKGKAARKAEKRARRASKSWLL